MVVEERVFEVSEAVEGVALDRERARVVRLVQVLQNLVCVVHGISAKFRGLDYRQTVMLLSLLLALS